MFRSLEVVERIMHSGYSPRSFSNDIALIALDRDVDYREDIAPVCLPLLSDVVEARSFVGTRPFVAGWGATRFQGPTSNTLQYAGLQVRSATGIGHCNETAQQQRESESSLHNAGNSLNRYQTLNCYCTFRSYLSGCSVRLSCKNAKHGRYDIDDVSICSLINLSQTDADVKRDSMNGV